MPICELCCYGYDDPRNMYDPKYNLTLATQRKGTGMWVCKKCKEKIESLGNNEESYKFVYTSERTRQIKHIMPDDFQVGYREYERKHMIKVCQLNHNKEFTSKKQTNALYEVEYEAIKDEWRNQSDWQCKNDTLYFDGNGDPLPYNKKTLELYERTGSVFEKPDDDIMVHAKNHWYFSRNSKEWGVPCPADQISYYFILPFCLPIMWFIGAFAFLIGKGGFSTYKVTVYLIFNGIPTLIALLQCLDVWDYSIWRNNLMSRGYLVTSHTKFWHAKRMPNGLDELVLED